jgi:hypothetical protein
MITFEELLIEKCYIIYQQRGQSGVFEYIAKNHPQLDWKYCEPCEIESPVCDNECLVCSSPIK